MRKKLLGLFDSDLVYMERFYGFLKDSRIPFNVVAFTDVEALMGQNGKEVPDYLVVSEDYLNKVDNFPGVKIGIFEERNPRGLYRYSPADENLKTLVKLLQISESDYGLGNATSTKFIGVLTKVPEEVGAQLLLLTWACLEAVTDVRTLLNGGKTEVIKDAKDFNVSLNGLVSGQLFLTGNSEVGDDLPSSETEDSSNISFKLSYEDYLRIFLYLIPTGIRTLRTMDMIEQNLRFCLSGENHYFCFDACADQVEVTASVETGYDYRFITQKKYSF